MQRKTHIRVILAVLFLCLSETVWAGIDLNFEYFRLRSKAPPDVAQSFSSNNKFRQDLEKKGWTLIQNRSGDSFYARREVISSRSQLETAMGGQPLTEAQMKLLSIYDFATGDPRFRKQLSDWGSLNSSCYENSAKNQAGVQLMPIHLVDTTNVTDVPKEKLSSQFTPWGQKTVMMSTAYIQESAQQNPVAVFVHEFSHTLDSNSMNYDQAALGKDRSHYMNEITSESNALSEAWAEYNQVNYFPEEGLTWGAGGLSDFSGQIKIERQNGGYDFLTLDQIPSTGNYYIPENGTRKVTSTDLLKIETVNLLALRNLSTALDLAYGPGTCRTLLFDAFRFLNFKKTVGAERTLGALFKALLERSGPRFPLLPQLMKEAVLQATEGKIPPDKAAALFLPAPVQKSIPQKAAKKGAKTSGRSRNPFEE